uniref:Uncharacterized protein n=1 Tax=Steinernema glaseri TaxID=37863 RepID=A0A1I8AA26_9BILA
MAKESCELEKSSNGPTVKSFIESSANGMVKRPPRARTSFVRPTTTPAVLPGTMGPNGEAPPPPPDRVQEQPRVFEAYRLRPRNYEGQNPAPAMDLRSLGPNDIPTPTQLRLYYSHIQGVYENSRRFWDGR